MSVKVNAMKPPVRGRVSGRGENNVHPLWWTPPDKEWLAKQYARPPEGLGKPASTIAKEIGCCREMVERWLKVEGLMEPHSERHSFRMAGDKNAAWNGGTTRKWHRRHLKQVKPDEVCEWCGSKETIEVHHKDHDYGNGDLDNLAWLCHYCNLLEAYLWALGTRGRLNWKVEHGKLTGEFVGINT